VRPEYAMSLYDIVDCGARGQRSDCFETRNVLDDILFNNTLGVLHSLEIGVDFMFSTQSRSYRARSKEFSGTIHVDGSKWTVTVNPFGIPEKIT
jgi:hypothetical protein